MVLTESDSSGAPGQPPESHGPGEAPLGYPPPGQQHERVLGLRQLHHRQLDAVLLPRGRAAKPGPLPSQGARATSLRRSGGQTKGDARAKLKVTRAKLKVTRALLRPNGTCAACQHIMVRVTFASPLIRPSWPGMPDHTPRCWKSRSVEAAKFDLAGVRDDRVVHEFVERRPTRARGDIVAGGDRLIRNRLTVARRDGSGGQARYQDEPAASNGMARAVWLHPVPLFSWCPVVSYSGCGERSSTESKNARRSGCGGRGGW